MGKVIIIAEAGVNHNGKLDLAKKLAYEAKECGADIVKYQTANVSALVSRHAQMATYQKKNIGKVVSQKEMLENLMLSYDEFEELAEFCREIDISFLSTPFDIPSINFLKDLGCDIWKIPSGEITNYPYLKCIAKTEKKVIMSTGMSTLEEVEWAFNVLKNNGTRDIVLLHCTTEYPAPLGEINLNAMQTMRDKFGVDVGYSDHTEGMVIPIAAVAMGAKVIEKHFTIDKKMVGPDHKASLNISEFNEMVKEIRNVEKALGNGMKYPTKSEEKNIPIARKSIVAACEICRGEIFTEDNITTKRPGNGISPVKWNDIIGRIALKDYHEDDFIEI